MCAGLPSRPQGTVAAYIQDDGRFVIYSPTCDALAETPQYASVTTHPPCMSARPDVKVDAVGGYVEDLGYSSFEFDFNCGEGYITKIEAGLRDVRVSPDLPALSCPVGLGPISCSASGSSPIWGSGGDYQWRTLLPDGISSITVYHDEYYIRGLQPDGVGATLWYGLDPSNEEYISGSISTAVLSCPPGMVVSGLHGKRAELGFFYMGVYCRSACLAPATSDAPGLVSCTSQLSPAGKTCRAQCPQDPAHSTSVTCMPLGGWKVDAQCPDMQAAAADTCGRCRSVAFDFACPPGTYVASISGQAADWIYSLGPIRCSDGSSSGYWGTPKLPSTKWQRNFTDGYTKLEMLVDDESINQIRLSPTAAFRSDAYGGNLTVSECPRGTIASGVYGRAAPTGKRGEYIFSLGLRCRMTCTKPVTDYGLASCTAKGIAGQVCQGQCPQGSTGKVQATCSSSGAWETTHGCTIGCNATLPARAPRAYEWRCEQDPNEHGAYGIGYQCRALCSVGSFVTTQCIPGGQWSTPDVPCPREEYRIAAPGNRTWLFNLLSNSFTQPEARAYCQRNGGELLAITSAEDNAAINAVVSSKSRFTSPSFWTGLFSPAGADHGDPATYRWLSTNTAGTYSNWAAGNPSDASQWSGLTGDMPACMGFPWSDANAGWGVGPCDLKLSAACQLGCTGVQLPLAPGNSTWPDSLCDGAAVESNCTASCTNGYVPAPTGAPTVTCTENNWAKTVSGACVRPCFTGQATVVGPSVDVVCPTANSKAMSFRVSSNKPGVPVGRVTVNATTGESVSCTVGPSTNVPSGNNVTVTCSKAAATPWPASGFTVTVAASATEFPGCVDTGSAQTTLAPAVPTVVTLAAPGDPAATVVCPIMASRVLNYTFNTLPEGVGLSSVTLASSGPLCSVANPTNVPAGRALTVTCNRPGGVGWVPFSLNLTATSAANSCGATGRTVLSTAFTVPQNPNLMRTSPTTSTLCSTNPNVTLTYTLSSPIDGAQFNMVPTTTNAAVVCTASPSIAMRAFPAPSSPTEVTVTCQRPTAGWPGFGVMLTAMDRAGCRSNLTNTTTFTIQQKPTVSINGGTATVSVCAYAPTLTQTYTVTSSIGGMLSVDATTNTTDVACTLKNSTVAANTGAVVTCTSTRTSGGFPAAFAITITASSGPASCGNTTSRTVVATSTCCVSGATYARDANRSQCLSTLGCEARGFVNNFAAATAAVQYPLVYGDCTTVASTGTISVACAASGANSQVTINLPTQTVTNGTAVGYFYAGCSAPSSANSKCSPTAGWGAPTCTNTAVSACGGAATANRVITLSCSCASVRWIVASMATAGASFTASRANGECLR